jgi:hypothetical protein
MQLGGLVIFTGVSVPLIRYLADHAEWRYPVAIGLLLALYLAIPITYFVYGRLLGVRVERDAIKSVSYSRTSTVAWRDITAFVVDRYTPFSVCVLAEKYDGTRVPLNALAVWAPRRSVLYPYRDALTGELAAARERERTDRAQSSA